MADPVISPNANPEIAEYLHSPLAQPQGADLTKYSSWNGDWKGYLTYMADHGDASALDKLMNYMMSEDSAQSQREWDAHSYSRLFDDMKSAGINPYAFATMGASPISSSSNTHYSGSYSSSYEIQKAKIDQNWLKMALSAFIPIIGGIIAALL